MADSAEFREEILRRMDRMEKQINLLRIFFVDARKNQLATERWANERARVRRLAKIDVLQGELAYAQLGERFVLENQEFMLSFLENNTIWRQPQSQNATSSTHEGFEPRTFHFGDPLPPSPEGLDEDDESPSTPSTVVLPTTPELVPDLATTQFPTTVQVQNASNLKSVVNVDQESDGRVQLDTSKAETKANGQDQPSTITGWIKPKKSSLKKQSSETSQAARRPGSPWPIRGTRIKPGPSIFKTFVFPTSEERQNRTFQQTFFEYSPSKLIDLTVSSQNDNMENGFNNASMPPRMPPARGQVSSIATMKRKFDNIAEGQFEDPPVKVSMIETSSVLKSGKDNEEDETVVGCVKEDADPANSNNGGFERMTDSEPKHQTRNNDPDAMGADYRKKGLLNGPHKHVIQAKYDNGKIKTMSVDPDVFDKLMAKRATEKMEQKKTEDEVLSTPETCRNFEEVPTFSGTSSFTFNAGHAVHKPERLGNSQPLFWKTDFPSTQELPHVDGVQSSPR